MSIGVRWDPKGVLQLPEMKEVLVAVHLGPSAKLACRRGGRNYSGTAVHGDIDIIPAHTAMRWEMRDQNDRCLLMTLPDTLLQTVAAESDLNAARMEIIDRWQVRDNELETLSWSIKREIDSGFPSGRVYLDGLTLAVASRLVMRHSSVAQTNEQRQGGLVGQRLKQVLSFIEEQLGEDLSLEKIAAIARVSPSHLNSLFRKSIGLPVHRYIIQRRVEKAKTLLQKDGLSLAEIALTAGFSHPSHMARHMRRLLGASPRAIRNLHNGGSRWR
jgi:AraC family transcriptional regulator